MNNEYENAIMNHTIDCFVPHCSEVCAEELRSELVACPLVTSVNELLDTECEDNAPFIPLERSLSTRLLKTILQCCTSNYVLLYTHAGSLRMGYRAIERMLRAAVDSDADFVYSHRYVTKQGETLAVPTNEYQEGSVRDDFDFGPLMLIRVEAIRQFLATQPEEMLHAALYQLRLYISRTGRLVHINEYFLPNLDI